ncbi:O-antigen ligase family protein [Protofrankia symbiont of Coriaria ruscifolia]|uniref:O-antigen ligase family protein n=1 Tax=Protofrankia symbiont of Coriaria ruscifolia TaxID=1306542 RepID=UPI001041119E|nr:O-antigen ligase family protein [Protofrankia symbiont of Coriaria ruscifolia]
MTSSIERTLGSAGIFITPRRVSLSAPEAADLRLQLLRRGDAVVAVTALLILMIIIPARMRFAPLGAAGNPALLLGMLLFVWYIAIRLVPWQRPPLSGQGMRILLTLFGLSVLISYVAAMTRPISGAEIRAADRGVLTVIAALGLAFTILDGVPSRERLDVLLRRVCTAGTVLAIFGLLQFYFHFDINAYIRIPGLSGGSQSFISGRDGLVRVAGTASHPIEFGVVLAAILPLALHFALYAPRDGRRGAWFKVAVIGLTLPMSVSRSAILTIGIALLVLVPSWPARLRRRAVLLSPVALLAMQVASPGTLRTIFDLFLNIGNDDSAAGRTADYATASVYIDHSFWLGRGYGTFLPEKYRVLDNAYLGHLIETGIIGLGVLLLLFIGTFVLARRLRRDSQDPELRNLAQTLAGSVIAVGASFVTFDALGYAMVFLTAFLLIGSVGALMRLEALRRIDDRSAAHPAVSRPWSVVSLPHPGIWNLPSLAVRRWYVVVAVGLLVVFGALHVRSVRGTYEATAALAVFPQAGSAPNPYQAFNLSNQTIVRVVAERVNGRGFVVDLNHAARGAEYVVAAETIGTPENPGAPDAPTVIVTVWSSDPDVAIAKMRELVTQVGETLQDVQETAAPSSNARLTAVPALMPGRAALVTGNSKRALGMVFLLGVLGFMFILPMTERVLVRAGQWRAARPATHSKG